MLQIDSSLDYEQHRWHNLTVRARDPTIGVYADAVVVVSVTDVNDNPPVFVKPVVRTSVSEAAVKGVLVAKVSLLSFWSYIFKYICINVCMYS